jgi:hypothetical protein
MEGGKIVIVLKNIVTQQSFGFGKKKNLLFHSLVTPVILHGREVRDCNISRESWRNIEHIQKNFITYNLKIKGNTPYPILLIEAIFSPI